MPHIVYTERSEAKRRFIRTDGALYVLLLAGAFGAIALSRVLADRLDVNRLYVQIGLYAVLLGTGYLIYRVRLVDYLYELYDGEFRAVYVVGSKQKPLISVSLSDVTEIGPFRKSDAKPTVRAYHGARENTTAVWFKKDGKPFVLYLNASETMKEKLAEAVHAKD